MLNKLWDEQQHFFGTRWYRENEARALVASAASTNVRK